MPAEPGVIIAAVASGLGRLPLCDYPAFAGTTREKHERTMDRGFPDRSVRGFRPRDDPPDVFRFRHIRRRNQFRAGVARGPIFRADEETIPLFEAEGSTPFQYQTRTKTVTVNSYWQLPARLFDDPEELSGWARAALAAAQRAALRKRPRTRKLSKPARQKLAKKAKSAPKRSSP